MDWHYFKRGCYVYDLLAPFAWKQHAYSIKPNDLLELTRHFTPLQLHNSRDLSINLNWSQIKQNVSVFPFRLFIYLNENVNLVSDYIMISVSYAGTQGNSTECYRMLSVVHALDACFSRIGLDVSAYYRGKWLASSHITEASTNIYIYLIQYLC